MNRPQQDPRPLARPWWERAAPREAAPTRPVARVFELFRAIPTDVGPRVFQLDAQLDLLARRAGAEGVTVDVALLRRAMAHQLADAGDAVTLCALAWREPGGGSRQRVIALPRVAPARVDRARQGVQLTSRRRDGDRAPDARLGDDGARAEVLWVDDAATVVDATGADVFVVHGDAVTLARHRWRRPGLGAGPVAAIADARPSAVSLGELHDADEVFLVGAAPELIPVTHLDERRYAIGAVTRALQDRLTETLRRAPAPWLAAP